MSSNNSSDTISIENDKANNSQNQTQSSTQESSQAQQSNSEQKGILGSLTSIAPMILIFVVFYFLVIRPQEKKRKAQEELIKTVKKGEEIVTNSGIYGVVSKVSDDGTLEVEISKGVNVKFSRAAVGEILSRKKQATTPAPK